MVDLPIGSRMWLPCEVKPGPFTNERMVLVQGEGNPWFGFVNTLWLKDGNDEGADEVLAKVVEVTKDRFRARIPGSAPQSTLFEGRLERVAPR